MKLIDIERSHYTTYKKHKVSIFSDKIIFYNSPLSNVLYIFYVIVFFLIISLIYFYYLKGKFPNTSEKLEIFLKNLPLNFKFLFFLFFIIFLLFNLSFIYKSIVEFYKLGNTVYWHADKKGIWINKNSNRKREERLHLIKWRQVKKFIISRHFSNGFFRRDSGIENFYLIYLILDNDKKMINELYNITNMNFIENIFRKSRSINSFKNDRNLILELSNRGMNSKKLYKALLKFNPDTNCIKYFPKFNKIELKKIYEKI